MNHADLSSGKRLTAQKVFMWLLLLALLLLMARIGARHYFRPEAVKAGTLPVTFGRILALWTITLLMLQPILASRCRFLDSIFGLDHLLKFHRISGIACLGMAFSHPMLMYVSGLKKLGPLSIDHWPEAIGGLAIVGLWLTVVSSVGRKFVELSYEQWLRLHKFTAPVVVVALAHMFIIESAMRKGWLLGFWVILLVLWAGALVNARIVLPGLRRKDEAFIVSSVEPVAENIWEINLQPAENVERFSFIPGQFAFISVQNPSITEEEHPFTIASAPADQNHLQFLVKACGDWTRQLKAVKPGDCVKVSGPFGVFSPFRHDGVNSLIMIAGGIGITPMLSVLRQLAFEKSTIALKLIWSFRSSAEAPCQKEIEGFRSSLPALEVVKIATREKSNNTAARTKLVQKSLEGLVPEYRPGTLIMLCGPAAMMKDLRCSLLKLGYPASAIISEEFAL